jgi:putative DNA primase/helicase
MSDDRFARDDSGNIIDAKEIPPDEPSRDERDAQAAADLILSAAGEDASKAFEPDVIELAADFERTSRIYQALIPKLREAKVRIADWERAVKGAREARARARAEEARKASNLAKPPSKASLETVRRWIDANLLKTPMTNAIRPNLANVITILVHDPVFEGRIAYHELREAEFKTAPIPWHPDDAPGAAEVGDWTQQDSTRLASWLARTWGIDVHSKLAEEAAEAVARRHIINPVKEYLERVGKAWDGRFRIGGPDHTGWLTTYIGAPDTPYSREVGYRWLVAASARALYPGCQADNMLTLISILQGTGKSSLYRGLCHDETWFFDDELKIGDKDAAQSLRGKWMIELAELSSLTRGQLEAVKAFITRRVDSYRPTLARRSRDFPRRCIFGGSTNNPEPFTDEDNRRFLPVSVGKIDLDGVRRDRDQIWGEAVFRLRAAAHWHIDTPELAELCKIEQELRAQADPWEAYFADYLDKLLSDTAQNHADYVRIGADCECPRCAGRTVAACLEGALKMPRAQADRRAEMRGAAVLRRLGWSRPEQLDAARKSVDGRRVRPYYPPTGR